MSLAFALNKTITEIDDMPLNDIALMLAYKMQQNNKEK